MHICICYTCMYVYTNNNLVKLRVKETTECVDRSFTNAAKATKQRQQRTRSSIRKDCSYFMQVLVSVSVGWCVGLPGRDKRHRLLYCESVHL